jgi:hypothetical protein
MAGEPDEDPAGVVFDDEAIVDEEPAEQPLVDAAGLGVDLPEGDTLDQRREVELDDDDER